MLNIMNTQYMGNMTIGLPNQTSNVVFDTGSTWLVTTSSLCEHSCKTQRYNPDQSSKSHLTNDTKVTFSYGSAELTGKIYEDVVCMN